MTTPICKNPGNCTCLAFDVACYGGCIGGGVRSRWVVSDEATAFRVIVDAKTRQDALAIVQEYMGPTIAYDVREATRQECLDNDALTSAACSDGMK